ncbi:hypothetical protein B4U80_14374, partial [Leptotrombidium deliense]
MKTAIILAVLVASVAADIDPTWLNSCLVAHNNFRAQFGYPALQINQSFCDFTEQRAQAQVPICSLSHAGLAGTNLGENLAAGHEDCAET